MVRAGGHRPGQVHDHGTARGGRAATAASSWEETLMEKPKPIRAREYANRSRGFDALGEELDRRMRAHAKRTKERLPGNAADPIRFHRFGRPPAGATEPA